MGRPLTAPGPVGGCSLGAMVLMGLLVEWRRYEERGEMDAWFLGALALGLVMGFAALTIEGRPRRVAGFASLYLLLGAPVALFAGAVARAAGWT
jgi:hypothetical protein